MKKLGVLDRSYLRFKNSVSSTLNEAYDNFIQMNEDWLEDFALFMALKEAYGGGSWVDWPMSLRDRSPIALAEAREKYVDAINRQKFSQFVFFEQWSSLKTYLA